MCRWFVCVFFVFLAACGEELENPIDWAIHPDVKGKEREILCAVLAVVFEECPDIGKIDWETVAKKEGEYAYATFTPSKIQTTDLNDFFTMPYIEGWKHHSTILIMHSYSEYWTLNFSWEEPPGISTAGHEYTPARNERRKNMCDFNHYDNKTGPYYLEEEFYFFKRVDRLAEVVKEVEARY
jgi:hypothetical protein